MRTALAASAYNRITERFGKTPQVQVFSPTQYRVAIRGWQVHSGASTSEPFADGRSLEKACEALLRFIDDPAAWVHEGSCDHLCHAKYSRMRDKQVLNRKRFRTVVEEAAATVARWPAWKRGEPPCEDDDCEGVLGHDGKHWRAKPVEYDEW